MAETEMGDGAVRPLRTPDGVMFEAQESEEGGDPEIKRPPDGDDHDLDAPFPETPNSPGAPPFTGEDVEDAGKPDRKKRDLPVM